MSPSEPSNELTPTNRPSAAACEACRKMKMKCIRSGVDRGQITPCERCERTNRTCRIPEPRPLGRKRGARGRYQGFDKAVRKLRSEMKKAKMDPEAEGLQELIHIPASRQLSPSHSEQRSNPPIRPGIEGGNIAGLSFHHNDAENSVQMECDINSPGIQASHHTEPISNPLALLADASDAARALESNPTPMNKEYGYNGEVSNRQESMNRGLGSLLHRPGYVSLGLKLSREGLEHALDNLSLPPQNVDRYSNYFKRPTQSSTQDTGPDLDPIELGLVTMEEAEQLFPIYFSRLHPINGILDPILHTPEFVRAHSALLFTWVLALTAQFDHGSASIAKRLRLHGDKLSRYVHTSGFKSVEIVQGYYISLLSATPADTLAEERSWLYTMYAFGVAAELGLDQYNDTTQPQGIGFTPNSDLQAPDSFEPSPQGTTARQETSYDQRLIRNRERTWFRILLWERANSAAYGRIHSFPETTLTKRIESWWMHPLADYTDRHTSAFIVLRRILASLNNDLRDTTESPHPHWVRDYVDRVLQPWCNTWLGHPATEANCSAEQLSNLFLRYVYLHGRLWTLSIVLHNFKDQKTSDPGLRNDCFEAAINVCEVAAHDLEVIGEPLYCMLAPTWAMISYAAVLALKLFPAIYGPRVGSQIELFALLSEVALQLERAGKTPSHRYGIAALLGQHITMILRAKSLALRGEMEIESSDPQMSGHVQQGLNGSYEAGSALANSTYDPFLVDVNVTSDLTEEGFADLFREIFGPGFGGVF